MAGVVGAVIGSLDGVLATGGEALEALPPGGRGAAIGLSLVLLLPVALVLGTVAGGLAFAVTRWITPEGLTTLLGRGVVRGVLAAGGAGIGGAMAFVLSRKEIDWAAVDWTLPVMGLGAVAAYGLLAFLMRRLGGIGLLIVLTVLMGSLAAGLVTYNAGGGARGAALTRVGDETMFAGRVLRRVTPLFDSDGDGFPTALCASGCDCDDTRPNVNPGAEDVPANGIDEDCSGEDATRAAQAEYAAVFGQPTTAAAGAPATNQKAAETHVLPGPTYSPLAGLLPRMPGGKAPTEPADKPAKATSEAAPDLSPEVERALAPPRQKRRPNILMITVDTLRADHLGVYGYARNTSPNIDRWAQNAVVFEQARTTGPSTRFSVAPALVSKWFTEIKRGKYEWPVLSKKETFLAERLDALGYRTAAFHSIRYFRKKYGFTQGFDHYSVAALDERGPPLKMISSDFITDEVLTHVDETLSRVNEPWFIWAYYGDPHSAYMLHPDVPKFGPHYKDTYDNEIAFVDKHLGRLFEGLRKRGQWSNTVVVLWSDHGEGLDPKEDHGTRYHSKNLYDELIRVPLIISGPGMTPRRVATPVSMIDMTPTLMDWLGEDVDVDFRGRSLKPFIDGYDPPHPPSFAEKHRKKDNPQKAMVMWPHKLIVHFPQMHVEVYNLAEDPRERRNIADTMPAAERRRLMGVFRHWLTRVLEPQEPNWRH